MTDSTSDMERLKQELDDTRVNMQRAATIGQQLLDHNKDLEQQLEQLVEENDKKVEALEQEKYSLKLQLNSKEQLEEYHKEEIDNLKEKLKKDVSSTEEYLNRMHARELQKMKISNEDLKASLDMASLKESQFQDKIGELEQRLDEAESSVSNRSLLNSTTMEERTATLLLQNAELKSEKVEISCLLRESEEIRKQQDLINSNQMRRLEELQERAEDEHKQSISYYRALEEVRQQLEEKQAELDLLKMETQDPNRKGNSLFAEVETKRQEIEKKYISLQVQHDSAKKQLNLYKQRVRELKYQIAGLLQMDNGRVAASQFHELEQALGRNQAQVQELTNKLNEYEKAKPTHLKNGNGKEDESAVAVGAKLVEHAKKKTEEVRKELQNERLLRIASEVKVGKFQSQLYTTKQELERLHATNIKMEIRIGEMKIKMARTDSSSSQKDVKGGFVEKINLPQKENSKSLNQVTSDGHEEVNNEGQLENTSYKENGVTITDQKITDAGDEDKEPLTKGEIDIHEESPNGSKRSVLSEITGQERKRVKGAKKSVSISNDVKVIEVSGSCDKSVDEHSGHSKGEMEETKGRRRRRERNIVYVGNRTNQNECKQQ